MRSFLKYAILAGALIGGIISAQAQQVFPNPSDFNATVILSRHVGCDTDQIPVPTGTGTPTIAAGSCDSGGTVTAGASATSVVITFATVYALAPSCVVGSQTQLAAFAYTVSTTAITITQTATSGNLINYYCMARGGGL